MRAGVPATRAAARSSSSWPVTPPTATVSIAGQVAPRTAGSRPTRASSCVSIATSCRPPPYDNRWCSSPGPSSCRSLPNRTTTWPSGCSATQPSRGSCCVRGYATAYTSRCRQRRRTVSASEHSTERSIRPDGPIPLDFSFRTQDGPPPEAAADPIPACREVLDVFQRGGCSSAICHQSATTPGCPVGYARTGSEPCVGIPRMGLDLASAEGLLRTAVSKVAHQTDNEANAGVPTEMPPRFGLRMPIIDPGRPDNSYLVYKMVVSRSSYGPDPCGGSVYLVGLGGLCLAGSAAETDRLRDWFVRGEPMPPSARQFPARGGGPTAGRALDRGRRQARRL